MIRRPAALVAVTALLALVLAACTGMPTSGPVNPGLPASAESDTLPIAFLPDRPQPGASPEQIVDGFLRAGSGPSDNWAIARLFLAPGIHDSWQPNAGVTIDSLPDRALAAVGDASSPDAAVVAVQLTPTALVDATGAYSPSDAGPTPLSFQLAKQPDGQWRITKAPDGIVLDSDTFPRVYRSYSLMYFDPSWRHLVPDVRWYPSVNAPTRIVAALVNGEPSPWLQRSVVTAFPEDVTARAAVPVVDGVAQVELGASALTLPQATLDRMQTQLDLSLGTASIADVHMSADGAPLTASAVTTASTTVDARALVDTESGFGFLTAGEIEPVPGLSAAIQPYDARSIQTAADGASAAARIGDGTVVRISAAGTSSVVDARSDLIGPTIDPNGFVWTVPAGAPSAVVAVSADGARVDVGGAWPGSSRIVAMQVSRDGARIAALVVAGGRYSVQVAGVIRDDGGRPTGLGAAQELATVSGTAVALGWIDDRTVGAVSADGGDSTVLEQVVGGTGSVSTVAATVDAIAGARAGLVWLRATDASLFVKRGTNWQLTATGVRVLASEQGPLS